MVKLSTILSTKALPYVEQQIVAYDDLSQCTDHHSSIYKDSLSEDQTSDLTTSFVACLTLLISPLNLYSVHHKTSK